MTDITFCSLRHNICRIYNKMQIGKLSATLHILRDNRSFCGIKKFIAVHKLSCFHIDIIFYGSISTKTFYSLFFNKSACFVCMTSAVSDFICQENNKVLRCHPLSASTRRNTIAVVILRIYNTGIYTVNLNQKVADYTEHISITGIGTNIGNALFWIIIITKQCYCCRFQLRKSKIGIAHFGKNIFINLQLIYHIKIIGMLHFSKFICIHKQPII